MAGGSALGYGLPERETCCMLPLISFRILALCKKRTFHFIPAICKDCTDSKHRLRLLSFFFIPERKTCCILPLISFCILADINLQLTVFPHYCLLCTPYMFYLSIMLFLIPTKKNLSEWRIYETPPRHLHAQFSNLFLIIFLLQNVSFFTVLFAYLLKKTPEAYDFCIRFRSFLR